MAGRCRFAPTDSGRLRTGEVGACPSTPGSTSLQSIPPGRVLPAKSCFILPIRFARLRAIKKQYDPDGLLFVHHGVGSEEWSPDGFTRL